MMKNHNLIRFSVSLAVALSLGLTAADASFGVNRDFGGAVKTVASPASLPSCAAAGAGRTIYYVQATAVGSCSVAGASANYCACDGSAYALVNAEALGLKLNTADAIPTPIKVTLPLVAAGCNGASATPAMDTPSAAAPTAECVTGSNGVTKGVLSFSATAAQSAQVTIKLPADWTGAIDVVYNWQDAGTSTDPVVWCTQIVCVADGEDDGTTGATFPDPAAANCVSDAGKATTAYLANTASDTGVTASTCAAGELMHAKFSRDPLQVSGLTDTNTSPGLLIGVELTLRRTLQ